MVMGDHRIHDLAREFVVSGGYERSLATVRAVCGPRLDAEDAVQDALARALTRDDVRSLGPWIAVVAINQIRQHERREARRSEVTRFVSDPPAPDVETHDQVLAAIRQLSPRQREIVVLHYFWDLPVLEVANLLRLSAGSVKVQLHRARGHLRTLLAATEEVGA